MTELGELPALVAIGRARRAIDNFRAGREELEVVAALLDAAGDELGDVAAVALGLKVGALPADTAPVVLA